MSTPELSLYLIGCGSPATQADATPTASAQTMGFKAWNLLRMAQMGLTVPPAFVIPTAACHSEASRASATHASTWMPGLKALQARCGTVLGDTRRPLLLAVRSGAPVSMPGMMETLLNIGLCDATVHGLIRQTGNPRLVWDAYRRLIATYGEVVAGLDAALFEQDLHDLAAGRDERDLDFTELRELTRRYLATYARAHGQPFPQDPTQQLADAIGAVLASWQSEKAVAYRHLHELPDDLGTAVTVQAMVFGNAGGRSGAGVGFTRDPATGEPRLWVDFLFNAQGEDVVSGRRSAHGHDELATVLPATWDALCTATAQLERTLGDMQDFEFTVQDGQLYMLQTRHGKRTPQAAARIALDLWTEGLINQDEARQRTATLQAADLRQVRVVAIGGEPLTPLGQGATACNGVATGEIALDAARAQARHASGAAVILVRRDAETCDMAALEHAQGLLTARGARTSHAAVVARQMGKVCLVGCAALHIDEGARTVQLGERTFQEGEILTLDGNDGCIYGGAAHTVEVDDEALLTRLQQLRQAANS